MMLCVIRERLNFITLRKLHQLVRVRFAPSPTGNIHLGSIRTALYNYAFAKSQNGKFILRVEDTDQSRNVPGAVEKIQEILEWTGIIPDEGPRKNGSYGPYFQSQRLDLYREAAGRLIKDKVAYHCFCPNRIKENITNDDTINDPPVSVKSYHKCCHLSNDQVMKLLNDNAPYCIRFKLMPSPVTFNDIIFGPITRNPGEVEPDPVILKADGFPTYHLANVVDDHLMDITHVLRGEEWLISTAKHILLYQTLGWNPPEFAHLPLMLNADGKKLSKREGHTDIEQFKNAGYYAIDLLNFITQFGGGFLKNDYYFASLSELVAAFSLSGVYRRSEHIAFGRLKKITQHHLHKQLADPESTKEVTKKMQGNVEQIYGSKIDDSVRDIILSAEYISKVLNFYQNHISRPEELLSPSKSFLWVSPQSVEIGDDDTDQEKIVCAVIETISEQSLEELNYWFKKISKQMGVKYPNFLKTMRACVTGVREGPSILELISILGKTVTLHRLQHSLKIISKTERGTKNTHSIQ